MSTLLPQSLAVRFHHPRCIRNTLTTLLTYRILPSIQRHVNAHPLYLYHIDKKKLVSRRQLADEIATSASSLPYLTDIGRREGKLDEAILGSLLRDHIRAASRYAILSHRWEHEELEFSDFQRLDNDQVKRKQGFVKFQGFCDKAREYACPYVWADTACIDKHSSTELDESIRSMYTWYSKADVCLVYLTIADCRSG